MPAAGSRRYSEVLKDEAVQLCRTMSMKKAAAMTGVGFWTIKKCWARYKRRTGLPMRPFKMSLLKYTPKQKTDCIKMAIRYADSGHVSSARQGFIAAGKFLGINGLSIYHQWKMGNVSGMGEVTLQPTQHPAGESFRAPSGDSSHTAIPQSQRLTEHQREVLEMRPAPKMIKRRKYTSDMIPDSVFKGHR